MGGCDPQFAPTAAKVKICDEQTKRLFQGLSELGVDLAVRSNSNVDKDLAFMGPAKYFMASIGGFSQRIVAPLVSLRGGIVISDQQSAKGTSSSRSRKHKRNK